MTNKVPLYLQASIKLRFDGQISASASLFYITQIKRRTAIHNILPDLHRDNKFDYGVVP